MEYITENKEQLLLLLGAIISVASAICALTPTPKAGTVKGKIYKLIEWAALNVGKAKETGDAISDETP